MTNAAELHDPRNLIRESMRIDGITEADCRSIFFDWALGQPPGTNFADAARALLLHYGNADPAHPMMLLLREAAERGVAIGRGRRGGSMGRRQP